MVTLKNSNDVITLYDDLFQAEQWDSVKAGEVLVKFQEYVNKVYVVRKGILKTRVNHGQEVLCLGFLVPGNIVGMLGAEHCQYFPYEIKAITDTEVYSVDRSRMEEVIRLVSAIDEHLKKQRAAWVTNTINRLKSMAFFTPYQRVVAWVIDYCKNDSYQTNKLWELLNNSEIAEYCNIKSEEYKVFISSLIQDKLIDTTNNNCTLLDKDQLEAIISANNY